MSKKCHWIHAIRPKFPFATRTYCIRSCEITSECWCIFCRCCIPHKGPYIKDVRKIFGFLDPLPPLVRILARSIRVNPRNLPYYVCFWATPLPPSRCGRPLCMAPYFKKVKMDNSSAQENITACYAMEMLLTHHPQARVALFCVILGSLILGVPMAWNVLWHLRASYTTMQSFSKRSFWH